MFEQQCIQVLNEAAALVPNRQDAKLLVAMREYWLRATAEQLGELEMLYQLPLPQKEPK